MSKLSQHVWKDYLLSFKLSQGGPRTWLWGGLKFRFGIDLGIKGVKNFGANSMK